MINQKITPKRPIHKQRNVSHWKSKSLLDSPDIMEFDSPGKAPISNREQVRSIVEPDEEPIDIVHSRNNVNSVKDLISGTLSAKKINFHRRQVSQDTFMNPNQKLNTERIASQFVNNLAQAAANSKKPNQYKKSF